MEMDGQMTNVESDLNVELAERNGSAAATNSSRDGHAATADGSATRRRILQIALTLMSQRGVDGTSMRDLASAAGLNVASLYHYFPSKRELLESVLIEQGFYPVEVTRHVPLDEDKTGSPLANLLAEIILSMFEVEEFVRLMVGEAMRDEPTARAVGRDLFATFLTSIEDWVTTNRPDLVERGGGAAVSRLLSNMVVGIFVEHATGATPAAEVDTIEDLTAMAVQRAREAAQILSALDEPSATA
jgi:AcrR family transcriptional regulator